MRNIPIENIPVLLVTNRGGSYGMGHYNRMKMLADHLKKMKISSNIKLGENLMEIEESGDSDISPAAYKVIILDSRDDEFPGHMLQQKTAYQYFLAVDNRGAGREQADIVWDTLPHPAMSGDELKGALRNCILNPSIFQFSGVPSKGKIIRCNFSDIESGLLHPELVQYPLKERDSTTPQEFQKKLIEASSIATYFGQTLFEALYLGKTVYLYDISDYHKMLSDWLMTRIIDEPEIVNLLDGQGLHRLTVLIRSIVSGVLDLPVG